jgi:hypothetical protein
MGHSFSPHDVEPWTQRSAGHLLGPKRACGRSLGSQVDAECMVGEPSLGINCDFPGTKPHNCLAELSGPIPLQGPVSHHFFEDGDSLIMGILLTSNQVLQSRRCHKPDARDDLIRRQSGKEGGF